MADGAFDIYQTASGYTAVHNPVQRQILAALAEGDLQLPDLVTLTGKSKPTLSSAHMKELLGRGLIEEREHPDDKRRKIYHRVGVRIGSSDLPVPQLRQAVENYVAGAVQGQELPLLAALAALTHVPEGTDRYVVWHQAIPLGRLAASSLRAPEPRAFWMRLIAFMEEQGIARATRIDLEADRVEMEALGGLDAPMTFVAAAVAGMAHGAFEPIGGPEATIVSEPLEGQRFVVRLK